MNTYQVSITAERKDGSGIETLGYEIVATGEPDAVRAGMTMTEENGYWKSLTGYAVKTV